MQPRNTRPLRDQDEIMLRSDHLGEGDFSPFDYWLIYKSIIEVYELYCLVLMQSSNLSTGN